MNYYEILGVPRSASHDEIKRAFHRLAHKYHPDKAGGDEAKFKEANEAYQVLSNPERRKQYDQFGHVPPGGAGFDPFGGFRGFEGFQGFDFGDIFSDFFGGPSGGRTSRPQKGKDVEIDIELKFEEAVFGAEKVIELYKQVICDACDGSGAERGSRVQNCSTCGGAGQVRRVQNILFGSFQTVSPCPDCEGSGKKAERICKKCSGYGTQKKVSRIDVKIPAGIDEGETLRVKGAGEAGRGGKTGDLFINVHVAPHKEFIRDGANILSKVYLSFSQAALGASIDILTIDGAVKLKIPAGTQSGQLFRLAHKGVPTSRGRGDHFVEAVIKTPTNLSRRQRQLMEEFEKE